MKKKTPKKSTPSSSKEQTKTSSKKQQSLTIDQILNMNNSTTAQVQIPLPPEFPPAPVVGEFLAKTEDEYKLYMQRKFLKEQWDNAVVLYRIKAKANDKEGMRQVINRINRQLKDEDRTETSSKSELDDDLGADIDELIHDLQAENDRNEPSQTPPSLPSKTYNPPPSEPSSQNEPDSDIDDDSSCINKWYRSTIYNTIFSTTRRRLLFIPTQIFFIVMIVVSTAVSNVAAGVLCALIFGFMAALLGVWIVWSFRIMSKSMGYVYGFTFAEISAEILAIVGGFGNNSNYLLYVGILGIILVIIASVLAFIGIVKKNDVREVV